jgi:HTH-type transcriptional repressor of NAD biosynthesis genes
MNRSRAADGVGRFDTGLVVDRFMPLHGGHQYVLDFARRFVERLTVLVCSARDEIMPGEVRRNWVAEACPGATVGLVEGEIPVDFEQNPAAWPATVAAIRRRMPAGPDVLFASTARGDELARQLGAWHVPVDWSPVASPSRQPLPVRVRPRFVKRVVVLGPESTGKTTLCRDLARHYDTVYVPEYLRTWLDHKGAACEPSDLQWVVRGQRASEEALAQQANRVLFCDTDALMAVVYGTFYYGGVSDEIRAAAAEHRVDLDLVLDVDVPWIPDAQRDMPQRREEMRDLCMRTLAAHGRRYTLVRGTWDERRQTARRAVDRVLAENTASGQKQSVAREQRRPGDQNVAPA